MEWDLLIGSEQDSIKKNSIKSWHLQYELTDEEIEAQIEKRWILPGFMWNSNAWLADKLGLAVKHQSQKLAPHVAEKDTPSTTLGTTVKPGFLKGSSQVVTTRDRRRHHDRKCSKGSHLLGPEDFEYNDWTLYGENEGLESKSSGATDT